MGRGRGALSSFLRPTLEELVQRIADAFRSHLPGTEPMLRRSPLRAIIMGTAGLSHLVLGVAESVAREVLPDTATAAGVDRWRALYGLPVILPAKATGGATIYGTAGTAVPLGTSLVRVDGATYASTSAATVGPGGSVEVDVEADAAGLDGDADTGAVLTLATPIAGLHSRGYVASPGIAGGRDEEDVETMRARVLGRMGSTPTGGSPADFEGWARETGDVRRVWVYPNEPGVGEVTLRYTVDGASPIPTTAKSTEIQEYIGGTSGASPYPYADALSPAPCVGSAIHVATVAAQTEAFAFVALSPDTTDVRAGIVDAIEGLFAEEGTPSGTVHASQIAEAIGGVPGEVYHSLATPAGDVTVGTNAVPVRGVVTWPDGSTTP